jgi:hypothetical protein
MIRWLVVPCALERCSWFSPLSSLVPPPLPPFSACHVVIRVVDCNKLVVSLLYAVQSNKLLLVTKVSALGDCNMLWLPLKAVCTNSHNKLGLFFSYTCVRLKDVPAFWLTCAVSIISGMKLFFISLYLKLQLSCLP